MPVLGFVLSLGAPGAARDALLGQLGREAGVTLGELQGARLPLVLELMPHESHEDRVASWLDAPCILHVDYAFADFEDCVLDAVPEGESS